MSAWSNRRLLPANVSWFTRCCIATDVPGDYALDVNTAFAFLKNTTKPTATAFTLAEHVVPIVKMLDIAGGGSGSFARAPEPFRAAVVKRPS